jgi:hypothetical protein
MKLNDRLMKSHYEIIKPILTLIVVSLFGFFNTLNSQTWQKSFSAGTNDLNGKFLGGSEVLQLVSHKKKLYASVGYWQDETNIWYGGSNVNIGWGQIIRLDNADENWAEDLNLGASHLRPEVLKQVIFTRDAQGDLLPTPDTVLITAAYSPNFITSTVKARAFTRNDSNGTWEQALIFQGSFPAGENYSIRDIQVYYDPITNKEQIFVSVGTQGIFSGVYSPNITGKIQWNASPELGSINIRPLGLAIANNTLYFSSGNKLYSRNNGVEPTYSVAHDFSDLSTNINSAVGGIRGLTTIPNPNGNGEALLLMWCPNSQSKGVIYRLEPDDNGGFSRVYEAKIAQLMEDYLPGTTVDYTIGAYNEFYEFEDSITNETYHIIGVQALISGGNYPTWNGYYRGGVFVIRDQEMAYSLEEINGPVGESDTALVANRCYVASPFENDDGLYFGGFDPNGNTSTNMAWIFKKSWQTTSTIDLVEPDKRIKVYPNPAKNYLQIEINSSGIDDYAIISITGKKLKSGTVKPGQQIIDISALPPNLYLLKIGEEIIKFMVL